MGRTRWGGSVGCFFSVCRSALSDATERQMISADFIERVHYTLHYLTPSC